MAEHDFSQMGENLLAGLTDTSQALLGIALPGKRPPTAEDIEKAREAVLLKKTVRLKSYHVRTFDFSNEADTLHYEELIRELFDKAQLRLVHITVHDRRFVDMPVPKWLAMLQWYDLELVVKAHPAIVPTGDTDGKGST